MRRHVVAPAPTTDTFGHLRMEMADKSECTAAEEEPFETPQEKVHAASDAVDEGEMLQLEAVTSLMARPGSIQTGPFAWKILFYRWQNNAHRPIRSARLKGCRMRGEEWGGMGGGG